MQALGEPTARDRHVTDRAARLLGAKSFGGPGCDGGFIEFACGDGESMVPIASSAGTSTV